MSSLVTLDDREGVFAHFLKCPADGAEFFTLSWRRARPAEIAYRCPECQGGVNYLGTVTLSTRRAFSLGPVIHQFDDESRPRVVDPAEPTDRADVEIYSVGALLARMAEPEALDPHEPEASA